MLSSPHLRLDWGVCFCLLALGAGCKETPTKEPKPTFDCPTKVSRALAFSHLKEAHVSMEVFTVEAAKKAIALCTDGLSCAPPRGKAGAATVARLLVERATAYTTLNENDAALADLEAALMWAEQGKKDDPLLVPEIHMASARLHLRKQDHDEAALSASRARDSASRLGEPAAGLQCEALILEGDLAARRPRNDYPPEGYFKQVFEVARRYQYPETVWDSVERAAFRLSELDAQQRAELLGPIRALRESKIKDEEEQRLLATRGATPTRDVMSISSGSISGAEQTVAAMRAGFRDCFRRSAESATGGQALLTISVGANGAVEHVDAQSQNMPPVILDCLTEQAMSAQFNPPNGDHAIVNVPVTFISQ